MSSSPRSIDSLTEERRLKAFTCDRFRVPLPEWHRFPMIKYARLRDRVEKSGLVAPDELLIPDAASDEELLLAHDAEYLRKMVSGTLSKDEIRVLGFPWTASLVERSRRSVGATIAACRAAFQDGIAVNLAGGTHHAYRDHGAGFCVFNDAAVASRVLQEEGKAQRVVIVDCDVHQGDGTASIFAEDPTVFTFSIHGALNYPLQKQSSDLDVELEDGAQDDVYLEALERGVKLALERAKADLAIYLAGADPYIYDQLGRLRVTKAGLAARDRLVLGLCRAAGLPVAVTMAGGYAEDVNDTVEIHFQTVVEAASIA
jgi:acetoin utilization deacetylase AcuC-like enzyme